MKIYDVIIEYTSSLLDRPFSYVYNGEKNIEKYSRVMVEFASRQVVGIVVNIKEVDSLENYQKSTGFILKEIKEVIDEQALLSEELNDLAKEVAKYYYAPLISVYLAMLPPSLKVAKSYANHAKIAYEKMLRIKANATYDNLTPKQGEVLFQISNNPHTKKSEISPSICKALISKGKIEEYAIEKHRLLFDDVQKVPDLPLNEEQTTAYNTILNGIKDTYLLEGITGSGKTEVYIQVAKKMIESGKSVILLVPEITLTYQMVKRFLSRFDRVAILHSSLTSGERYDEYRRIKNGEVDIVIGARSAIFAPLKNLGLIVIDEEHSDNYKQSDQLPYYHALEVAKMRQKQSDCKIVLGSATPSLESKSRALKGLYESLLLTKRATNTPLPSVSLVDMKNVDNLLQESALISKPLKASLENCLNNHEQAILLVNRRGFSPFVSCRKCGYLVKCPECQVALTYHKENNSLMCHHCGFTSSMIKECPKCKSDKIFASGFGTEKVVDEVNKMFPSARVLRLDSDVSKKKNGTKMVLEEFSHQNADILVGTSIVSKGHDYPNVTLVGVVLADVGLAIPSFRAGETTFSLIVQALGRSGRGKKGEAIIQTYLPESYVLKYAAKQDYEGFYAQEIKVRKMLQNPPYTYLCLLTVSSQSEDKVIDAIYEINKYLLANKDDSITLIGPSEMFIKKYLNKYRRKIVLKYKNFDLVKPLLDELRKMFIKQSDLILSIDIGPYSDY